MIRTEGDILGRESDEYTALEAIEQQLIQQLRTAGIRKPREIELINQVMILRRERRRSFSAISLSAQKAVDENVNLKTQLNNFRIEMDFEINARKVCVLDALRIKDSEMHSIIQQNENNCLKKVERCSSLMKLQIEKISKTYEEKLHVVDHKIQELITARDRQDQQAAESIAFEMTAKAISDLNDRQNTKLQKFKETLRSVAEREREAIDKMRKTQGKLECSEEEKRIVLSKLYYTEGELAKTKLSEIEMRRIIRSLQISSEESIARVCKIQNDMNDQKNHFDNQLGIIDGKHTEELRLIDAKVRKSLDIRDETINSLTEKVSRAGRRQRELESILTDLHAGFSSGPPIQASKHNR